MAGAAFVLTTVPSSQRLDHVGSHLAAPPTEYAPLEPLRDRGARCPHESRNSPSHIVAVQTANHDAAVILSEIVSFTPGATCRLPE